jgi:hypothetical protein
MPGVKRRSIQLHSCDKCGFDGRSYNLLVNCNTAQNSSVLPSPKGHETRAYGAKLASLPSVTYSLLCQSCRGSTPALMYRLTASLLLILTLSGTFAPAALAISAESPHACCKRKPLHSRGGHSSEFQAPDSANHDCCRPLTISQRAQPRPPISGCVSQPSGALLPKMDPSYRIIDLGDSRSARAPPTFSIA